MVTAIYIFYFKMNGVWRRLFFRRRYHTAHFREYIYIARYTASAAKRLRVDVLPNSACMIEDIVKEWMCCQKVTGLSTPLLLSDPLAISRCLDRSSRQGWKGGIEAYKGKPGASHEPTSNHCSATILNGAEADLACNDPSFFLRARCTGVPLLFVPCKSRLSFRRFFFWKIVFSVLPRRKSTFSLQHFWTPVGSSTLVSFLSSFTIFFFVCG